MKISPAESEIATSAALTHTKFYALFLSIFWKFLQSTCTLINQLKEY